MLSVSYCRSKVGSRRALPPGNHEYVTPPEADNGAASPEQIEVSGLSTTTGKGITPTVAVSVAVNPLASVTTTM
jgi:hypothetical protein